MTVTAANETARTGYTATGGETTFDYTFEIAASGDLAVERNGDIVPRGRHAETWLADGDRVEIVVAVGGG